MRDETKKENVMVEGFGPLGRRGVEILREEIATIKAAGSPVGVAAVSPRIDFSVGRENAELRVALARIQEIAKGASAAYAALGTALRRIRVIADPNTRVCVPPVARKPTPFRPRAKERTGGVDAG